MNILVIAPHPDDEVLGCGGYILKSIAAGDEVSVLFLTSGEHGFPDLDVEEAALLRESEAIRASEFLGSKIVGFWHLPDGGLFYSPELRDRLGEEIIRIAPDTVLVTHELESHSDHRVAGKLVREAIKDWLIAPECLTYEVWTPQTTAQRIVDITDFMDAKLEAVRFHTSQMERVSFDEASLSLARYRGILYGRCKYAEVYNRMRLNGRDRMKVGIALLTYAPSIDHPRAAYARKTLDSTLAMIDPGPNELLVHIADDGSDPQHIRELIEISRKYGYEPTVTNAERGGYGKSYNLACQTLHSICDVILPLEDDWELTKPLKLEYPLRALEESNGAIRSIRLGYLGITQDLIGTVRFVAGMTYLILDPDSPEPHVFCGHPRLDTVEYQRDVGGWPEGIRAGDTEWEVTHRWQARKGVAWPMDLGIPASQDWGCMFAHIGSVSLNQDIPEGTTIG